MEKEEFKYYLDNQNELLKMYNGKYLMIIKKQVVGAFDTMSEAYYEGKKQYGLGNFLVQLCTLGSDAYTVTIQKPVKTKQ